MQGESMFCKSRSEQVLPQQNESKTVPSKSQALQSERRILAFIWSSNLLISDLWGTVEPVQESAKADRSCSTHYQGLFGRAIGAH